MTYSIGTWQTFQFLTGRWEVSLTSARIYRFHRFSVILPGVLGVFQLFLKSKSFSEQKKTSHCGHHDNQSHSCGLRLSSVEGFLANVPQGNHTQVGGSFFSKSFDVAHQCVPRHCGIPTDSWLRLYPSHHPSIRGDLTGS